MTTMSSFLPLLIAGFTFNVTASIMGQVITLRIMETSGNATFQCQLDSGAFVPCKSLY